ncbi:hypothetical protein [Yersinia similis]|uniref:hypothetical protein n=1 Tax=Yersinia similis TaxID=367190 RepID=UPI001643A449|nr:hypothetical protein [Yersinia similis]
MELIELNHKLSELVPYSNFKLDNRNSFKLLEAIKEYTHNIPFNNDGGFWDDFFFMCENEPEKLAKLYLAETDSDGELLPHQAFILAILQILETPRALLNILPGAHRSLYYRDLLGLSSRQAQPDQVALSIALNPTVTEKLLVKETLFEAGQDALGNPLHYALDASLLANRGYISDLRWLRQDESEQWFIAAPLDVQDQVELPATGIRLFSETVGERPVVNGCLIQAALLAMAEGERVITLAFAQPVTASQFASVEISSGDRWLVLTPVVTSPKVTFTLSDQEPAISAPDNLDGLIFEQPVLRLQVAKGQQLPKVVTVSVEQRPVEGVDTQVWGEQWPFKAGSVNDEAHQTYAINLKNWMKGVAQDTEQELNIINYLLGYFATQRAPNTFTINADDFLAVQQGYLAQQTVLTYHRDNIRVDQVSPLQKRIAARMGLGKKLFHLQPNLSELPFYLIEHRALLPIKPNAEFDGEQQPSSVRIEDGDNGQHSLVITQTGINDKLTQGQVVNLVLYEGDADDNKFILRGQMIVKIQGDSFWLDTNNSTQLQNNLERVLAVANAGRLAWQNSPVWLEDMSYRLAYASDQEQLPNNQRRLTRTPQTPFPSLIRVGSEITLTNNLGLGNRVREATPQLYAKVISFDRIQGTLVVERQDNSTLDFPSLKDDWRYHWHFSGDEYGRTDRFSFVISAVMNSDLIESPNVDPYKLEKWVKDTIITELPAHISMIIHWMGHNQFLNFGSTYQRWQNNGTPLGDTSYSILESLTLGKMPSGTTGIGTMRIATEAQRTDVVGSEENQWNENMIIQNELYYIPQERDE